MHSPEMSILKVVSYFDIFSYPLTIEEIIFFLDRRATETEISSALKNLTKTRQLWQFKNFYSTRNDAAIAKRRMQGNKLARAHIKKARAVAKFLSWFPYIRGIAISGSLSKNFADKNSDLDFFIITATNRLWIVRILYSVLYKIASLAGLRNWFCLNYFIDEAALEIKEQNIFTAVELSTLMPLKGAWAFRDFFLANSWVHEYQPNYRPNYTWLNDASPVIPKKMAEWIMNFERGNKLDDKLQAFFKKRFEEQTIKNKLSEKGLTIGAYKAEKHICAPLPEYFQPKILAEFERRFAVAEEKYLAHLISKEQVLATNINE